MEGCSLSLGLALTSVIVSRKGCCGCFVASSSFRLTFQRLLFDSPHPTPHLSLPRTVISTLNFRQPAWLVGCLSVCLSI